MNTVNMTFRRQRSEDGLEDLFLLFFVKLVGSNSGRS
jgi:hypothetical protein